MCHQGGGRVELGDKVLAVDQGLDGKVSFGADKCDAQSGKFPRIHAGPAPDGMAVQAPDRVKRLRIKCELSFPESAQVRFRYQDRHGDDLGNVNPLLLGFHDMQVNRRVTGDVVVRDVREMSELRLGRGRQRNERGIGCRGRGQGYFAVRVQLVTPPLDPDLKPMCRLEVPKIEMDSPHHSPPFRLLRVRSCVVEPHSAMRRRRGDESYGGRSDRSAAGSQR